MSFKESVGRKPPDEITVIVKFKLSKILIPDIMNNEKIITDNEASNNDKYVAFSLLKNANTAAGGILPMCQDTGTAIILAKKGINIITSGKDAYYLSKGVFNCYLKNNLRYSQVAAKSMYEEKNTKNNLPAQIEIIDEGFSGIAPVA